MRMSSNTIFAQGTNKLLSLQFQQANLQNQISTGKKVNVPSDDPIASSRILSLKQAESVNVQFKSNRVTAETQLNSAESILSSVTDLMINTKSVVVNSGNGALNDSDRRALALELQQNLDQLASLANSKDAVGNYMFSGYQTQTPAFSLVAGVYTYQGDANRVAVQVSETRQMEISNTGAAVFQAGGNDVFQEVADFIAILNTPIATPADTAAFNAGLQTALGAMDLGLSNVLASRADFGSKLKEIDVLNETGEGSTIVFNQNLSQLEELDYTKAISDLTKQQFVLEAAQKSFVKTTSLSLFDLI